MSSEINASIRAWAAERRLPSKHLERWLNLEPADAAAILQAVTELNLRTGQFVTILELLDELAVRERQPIAKILKRYEVAAAKHGGGSRPHRAKTLLEALRALRHPRMARLASKLNAEVAALRLPPNLAVLLPKDLSSDELRIEIRVRSGDELDEAAASIGRSRDALKRIIAALGGEDEV